MSRAAGLDIALRIFVMLGQLGDFDAYVKIAAIRGAFNISHWMFLPLVVVLMTVLKFLPFTLIFRPSPMPASG